MTDDLDTLFFRTASELKEALDYAMSPASDGEANQAFGRVVALARKLVTVDDQLSKSSGRSYYWRDFSSES
jgi:hypothetical protein